MHRSQLKGGFISNGFILARQSNGRKYTMILFTDNNTDFGIGNIINRGEQYQYNGYYS